MNGNGSSISYSQKSMVMEKSYVAIYYEQKHLDSPPYITSGEALL